MGRLTLRNRCRNLRLVGPFNRSLMPCKVFPFILLFYFFSHGMVQAQVTLIDNQTAQQLAQTIAGPGIVILNPVLTCPGVSEGIFSATTASNLGSAKALYSLPDVSKPNQTASASMAPGTQPIPPAPTLTHDLA